MVRKTIPGDERVQVLTESMVREDAWTVRVEEGGEDVRAYTSEGEGGPGFPIRSDDEIPVPEEAGLGSAANTDGLWLETETTNPTDVNILRGIALDRNVRREVTSVVSNIVETNNYLEGTGFDVDGSAYPYTYDPAFTVQEIVITETADIDMEVTTVGGNTFTVPLKNRAIVFDHLAVDSLTFRDPNATAAPIAGSLHGGNTQ